MSSSIQCCGHCLADGRRLRHRDFSAPTWQLLVAWQEIGSATIGHPLCDDCYRDIREVLIERSTEVEMAMRDPSSIRQGATAKDKSKSAETKVAAKKNLISTAKKAAKVSRIAS